MFDAIMKNPLLQDLLGQCPESVRQEFGVKRLKPAEKILIQGETPPYFCLLAEGNLKAYHTNSSSARYLILIHNPGDVMGEIEIADGRPCICTVEALCSATILHLPRDLYLYWLSVDAHFTMYLHQQLCNKVYLMAQKSAQDVLFPLKYRLLNLLKYLWESGESHPSAIAIHKEFLGEELGVTLRSVNRAIKELTDQGILNYENGHLQIISYPLLIKAINQF